MMIMLLMLDDPKKATVPPTCSGNVSKMIELGLSVHVDEPILQIAQRESKTENDGGEVKSKSEESTGGR